MTSSVFPTFSQRIGGPVREHYKNGLTMLDLKEIAQSYGVDSLGVKLPFEALMKLSAPAVLHIKRDGVEHFVVFVYATVDGVYVADPARGNVFISNQDIKRWYSDRALIFELKHNHTFDIQRKRAIARSESTRWQHQRNTHTLP